MKLVLGRLNKECREIQRVCGRYKISVSSDHLDFFIEDIFPERHDILVHIVIKLNYPFTPPYVYINKHEYLTILEKTCNKNGYKGTCIYCNSVVCLDIWKPAKKLKDIIDEIIRNKKHIINFLLAA